MPPCSQMRSLLDQKGKDQLSLSVSIDQDCSNSFACQDVIKEASNIKIFTPPEIKMATGNYNKQNIIGQGGFGPVFKDILPNNQVIAVKRQSNKPFHGKDEFINEVIILSQINNRNVVKLLGCCFDAERPSIVYEFIPNGTVSDRLFEKQNSCLLTWNHRLRIAVEVAQVLAYLHNTIREPIIHRDIKSANILLNRNYVAKVFDFGISKLLRNQKAFNMGVEDACEWDRIDTCVMGTYGHADPQYVRSGCLTKKSDVYSFGVVLTEILTRQKAWCVERGAGKRDLPTRFVQKVKGNRLREILDEQLVKEGSMKQLKKVARLAGRCLELKGEDRPTMKQVVRCLQDIVGDSD